MTPRRALVTGGAHRVGASIARALAEDGFHVVVHANSSLDEARALAAQLARASAVQADLSDSEQTAALVQRAADAAGGPIDCLINNASVFVDDAAAAFDLDRWDRHMVVNLRAPCQLAAAFAAAAPMDSDPCIVNLIDQRVFKPNPRFFSYTLSKSALLTATKTMAQAFAPGIRVNGVGPGPTLRNVHQSEADWTLEQGSTLLERGSPPDDIVAAVRFLIANRSVTGQMIAVDAGQHLNWRTPDVLAGG